MYLFYLLIVTSFVFLLIYISFLKMFKYAVLLMCSNDKYALSNLISRCNLYRSYLNDRDIPLSLILNTDSTYLKFIKGNLLFTRIDDYLSKFIKYNNNHIYLKEIENLLDSMLNIKYNNDNNMLYKKYPKKIYYLKIAIIVRFYKAYINIKPQTHNESWKKQILDYGHFNDDIFFRRIYLSICNYRFLENALEAVDNNEPSSIEIGEYLKNTDEDKISSYVSSFFYWHENPSLKKVKS